MTELGARTFGPSALLTPANGISLVRVLLTPALLAMVVDDGASWAAVGLWFVLCASDGADGYLARRQGTTRSGAFLDPLADKLCVLGAMAVLVVEDVFPVLPVAVVAVRELAMSVYRSVLGRRGVSVPARRSAKVKTVLQELAVGFALLPLTGERPGVAQAVLWVAAAVTVVTFAQYLADARAREGQGLAV